MSLEYHFSICTLESLPLSLAACLSRSRMKCWFSLKRINYRLAAIRTTGEIVSIPFDGDLFFSFSYFQNSQRSLRSLEYQYISLLTLLAVQCSYSYHKYSELLFLPFAHISFFEKWIIRILRNVSRLLIKLHILVCGMPESMVWKIRGSIQ